jgi:hypothetical protein
MIVVEPTETLQLVVEASLALAGFAGVVTALTQRGVSDLPPLHRLRLVNLLATSLGALFASLAALTMLAAGVDEASCWRILSGISVLISGFFTLRSIWLIAFVHREGRPLQGPSSVWIVNVGLLCVYVLQLWNAVHAGAFWPFLLMLVSLFAVGCLSFVGLLLPASDGFDGR